MQAVASRTHQPPALSLKSINAWKKFARNKDDGTQADYLNKLDPEALAFLADFEAACNGMSAAANRLGMSQAMRKELSHERYARDQHTRQTFESLDDL